MNDWCLMRVKFSGHNSQKVMRIFTSMARQDQRLPKKSVGLLKGKKGIESEFMCLISHNYLDLIQYIVEVPNIETLKEVANYYRVSFELYYCMVNGYNVAYSIYDYKTREFEILELVEEDFYGCLFEDCVYHFEGEIYPNKYSLRKYIWERKLRGVKIDKILEDIE